MFWFLIGVYTLILAIIWGFFIVIRIHALKFANFQTNIKKVVRVVFILLIVGSILGYISIFMIENDFGGIGPIDKIDKSNLEESLKNIDSNYY